MTKPVDKIAAAQVAGEVELAHAEITTATARMYYNEAENIIYLTTHSKAHIDVPEALENKAATWQLSQPRQAGILVIGQDEITTTPAMRALCATAEYNSGALAIALVSNKSTMKILGNFYLRINQPAVITRFFSTPEAGRNWLLRQLATMKKLA